MLMLKHLYEPNMVLENVSEANDSVLMEYLLGSGNTELDVQDAGTVFRFLVAYCSVTEGLWTIKGTPRLHERPISELVEALRLLGADISYLEKEGFAPLRIRGKELKAIEPLDMTFVKSSQFISALLMIAPKVKGDFEIRVDRKMNSYSYVTLTIGAMRRMGFSINSRGSILKVSGQRRFEGEYFLVEPDWTSFYYWYAMAHLADKCDLIFPGIHQSNMQRERKVMFELGNPDIEFEDTDDGLRIMKHRANREIFCPEELTLNQYPDLAPTFAMLFAALGCNDCEIRGLESLKFKESDREFAIDEHLRKMNCRLEFNNDHWSVMGDFKLHDDTHFLSYDDHRMAMCIAPLALLAPVRIDDEQVVRKSYPRFWDDLEQVGFQIDYI